MKRLLIVVLMLLVAMSAWAQNTIVGSKHDMSTLGPGPYNSTNESQICIFCHTPHFASSTQKPLWNRANTVLDYKTYWSPTINAYTQVNTPTVDGSSKMCLSCHDGVTAFNALNYYFGAQPAFQNNQFLAGEKANLVEGLGVNDGMANDHPVSFVYNDALVVADGELVAVANLPSWALESGSGKVQCQSCHDVHKPGAGGTYPFLNETKAGSALCLECHIK